MALIGLVTVLFKSDNVLEGFFKSLSIQSFQDYHLYVIDNSPSDATDRAIEVLIKQYPLKAAYTHIKNEKNVGIATGNNIGIRAALDIKCEYILLLNNDIEFYQSNLLNDIVATAKFKREKIIVPKIFFFEQRIIWMAGGRFDWWRAMTAHIGEGKADSKDFSLEKYFNYAPTCFMLIHKEVFENIGLMDEQYFVYYDDTDFVFRAMKYGYKIFYLPQLEIFHKVGSLTGGDTSLFSIYYGNRNRIYFIRKHLKGWKKLISFLYTFATRAIKYLKFNQEKKKKLVIAIKDGYKIKLHKSKY